MLVLCAHNIGPTGMPKLLGPLIGHSVKPSEPVSVVELQEI